MDDTGDTQPRPMSRDCSTCVPRLTAQAMLSTANNERLKLVAAFESERQRVLGTRTLFNLYFVYKELDTLETRHSQSLEQNSARIETAQILVQKRSQCAGPVSDAYGRNWKCGFDQDSGNDTAT